MRADFSEVVEKLLTTKLSAATVQSFDVKNTNFIG